MPKINIDNMPISTIKNLPSLRLQQIWQQLELGDNIPVLKSLLQAEISYELQQLKHGRLAKNEQVKLKRLIKQKQAGKAVKISAKISHQLPAGSIIKRQYLGRDIIVKSLASGGFEHEGSVYKSLSQLAQKITGSHISGPKFFGLRS